MSRGARLALALWMMSLLSPSSSVHAVPRALDRGLLVDAQSLGQQLVAGVQAQKREQQAAEHAPALLAPSAEPPLQIKLSDVVLSYDREVVRRVQQQREQRKLAYFKTHKTGSTTMGSIVFRYGARHHLHFFCQLFRDKEPLPDGEEPAADAGGAPPLTVAYHNATYELVRNCNIHIMVGLQGMPLTEDVGDRFDVVLKHISPDGLWHGRFDALYDWYRTILGADVGDGDGEGAQGAEGFALLTVMRQPASHYVSWYNYYSRALSHIPLRDCLVLGNDTVDGKRHPCPHNPLAQEFGVRTQAELDAFLRFTDDLRLFDMIVILEEWEASLVLLRQELGWSNEDLLSLTLTNATDLHKRWDGRRIEDGAEEKALYDNDAAFREALDAATQLDWQLYAAALQRLEEKKDNFPGGRVALEQQARELRLLNALLARSCARAEGGTFRSPQCRQLCLWYDNGGPAPDIAYERSVDAEGFVDAPPAAELERMYQQALQTGLFC